MNAGNLSHQATVLAMFQLGMDTATIAEALALSWGCHVSEADVANALARARESARG